MYVNDPGVLICALCEPRRYAGILAQVGMNKKLLTGGNRAASG